MSKGDETRQAILDEASQLASQAGFAGLTIGRLATHTGMSKSGLYAHFDSKQALQVDVLDHARRRFIDAVVRPALSAPRGLTRLRALFEAWIDWSENSAPGGCLFVAASSELDDQPGPARDALVRAELDWLETIATVASTAVSEGELRGDVEPEQLAYEVHALMLSHQHSSRLLRDPRALERVRRAFDSLLAAASSPAR